MYKPKNRKLVKKDLVEMEGFPAIYSIHPQFLHSMAFYRPRIFVCSSALDGKNPPSPMAGSLSILCGQGK
jgi:hypothetical protein